MFEIYGKIDFRQRKRPHSLANPFKQNGYYGDLEFNEFSRESSISKVFFLERTATLDNFYMNDDIQLFLFGTCFANRRYTCEVSFAPKRFSAEDVHQLYKNHGIEITQYLKGMFTIIIIDMRKRDVTLITDRTNLLPIYYYFRDNLFLFSSSLNLIIRSGLVDKKVNKKALAKMAIFNYIIGRETLIEGVCMQSYASVLHVSKDTLKETSYWEPATLYTPPDKRMSDETALDACNHLLRETVNLYVADQEYFAISFTGGYDSRAVLSLLRRDKKDFFCYSYGISGCYDLLIPRRISEDLDYDFRSIYFDETFESNFENYALKAIYYTDGMGSITKANIVYPCEKISGVVDVVLTGLFGSEMVKQPTSVGYYVSGAVKELLFDKSPYALYNRLIKHEMGKGYLRPDIVDICKDDIFAEFSEHFLSDSSDRFKFYNFLIREGIRKYYMQELKIERMYLENRHPYFDDDFADLLFQTPFAGIYNIKKGRNILMAKKPHQLYAYIIQENKPQLASYMTTHGYKPADILSRFGTVRALFDYWRYKPRMREANTFAYKQWVNTFCSRYMDKIDSGNDLFGDAIGVKYRNNEHLGNIEEFAKFLSLRLWFLMNDL